MTRTTVLTTLRLSLGGVVALVMVTGCPDQPKLQCATERTALNFGFIGFAGKYRLVSGEGNGPCAELKGDVIGVQQYHPAKGGKPDFSEGQLALQAEDMGAVLQGADLSGSPSPFQSGAELFFRLGDPQFLATDPDPNHHPYAIGQYESMDAEGGFCTVPTLRPAVLNLSELPPVFPDASAPDGGGDAAADGSVAATDGAVVADAMVAPDGAISDAGVPMITDAAGAVGDGAAEGGGGPVPVFPGQPAHNLTYEWSNVRVRMSAEFPGNAFTARVVITQDTCTATYEVNAVFPAVFCGDKPIPGVPATCFEPGPDAGPEAGPPSLCDTGICVDGACVLGCSSTSDCPSDAKCTGGMCVAPGDIFCGADPRPEFGMPTGSGIASNMPVRCDPDLGLCVLTKPANQL